MSTPFYAPSNKSFEYSAIGIQDAQAVFNLICWRWECIKHYADAGATQVSVLQTVLEQPKAGVCRIDGGIAAVYWVDPDMRYAGKVAYLHLVISPYYIEHYKPLFHKLLAHVFIENPITSAYHLTGIRHTPGFRALSRFPYGRMGKIYSAVWDQEYGLSDMWDWSVTRNEYVRIIDERTNSSSVSDVKEAQATSNPIPSGPDSEDSSCVEDARTVRSKPNPLQRLKHWLREYVLRWTG